MMARKSMRRAACFLAVLFLFRAQALFSAEKARSYAEQVSFIATLGSNFASEAIGTVVYGESRYPVYKVSYNASADVKRKYLIICGVHGNEPAPVYAIREFMLELDKTDVRQKDLQLDFIYILNPYGFETDQRYNGGGMDINRDLSTAWTQEARLLTENCRPKSYDRVFDFHEATAQGFFLYCYGTKNRAYSRGILSALQGDSVLLDSSYTDRILTARDGMLYVPFYASLYMKRKKTVTTGIYYSGCRNSFTFETPKGIALSERKRIIRRVLAYITECG